MIKNLTKRIFFNTYFNQKANTAERQQRQLGLASRDHERGITIGSQIIQMHEYPNRNISQNLFFHDFFTIFQSFSNDWYAPDHKYYEWKTQNPDL